MEIIYVKNINYKKVRLLGCMLVLHRKEIRIDDRKIYYNEYTIGCIAGSGRIW